MVWYDNLHGISVHLHTGVLVVALFTVLFAMIVKLIMYMYPRWGLIRSIFTDWTFTKKIYNHRILVFKSLDYTTIFCIIFGIIGLGIGMITGGNYIGWDFLEPVNRAKLVLSSYALLFYFIALVIRVFTKMWKNPGYIVSYGLAIGFGFIFVFLAAALGGLITYEESIAKPILLWLDDIGFFRIFDIPKFVHLL